MSVIIIGNKVAFLFLVWSLMAVPLHAQQFSPRSLLVTLQRMADACEATQDSDLEKYCNSDFKRLASFTIPSRKTVIEAADSIGDSEKADFLQLEGTALSVGVKESEVVSGLTQFLIKRANQEIRMAFVDRFEEWACPNKERWQNRVFPTTCQVLASKDFRLHKAVLRDMHVALRQDLKSAPRTVPAAAIRNQQYREDSIVSAYYVGAFATLLMDGRRPLGALAAILEQDSDVLTERSKESLIADVLAWADDEDKSLSVASVLYRLSLVASMLPQADGEEPGWPRNDKNSCQDYEALFVKALIVNVNGWRDDLEVGLAQDNWEQREKLINHVRKLTESIHEAIMKADRLYYSLQPSADFNGTSLPTPPQYAYVIDHTLEVIEVWLDFAQFAEMFGKSSPENVRRDVEIMRSMIQNIIGRDYTSAVADVYRLANEHEKDSIAIDRAVIRYASFITALAQAEDGEQAAQVIGNYAAPVASYRAKREGNGWYMQLNAYLGGSLACEKADEIGVATGGFAPIGIEFGRPTTKGSVGGLIQILDLGTPISYRLSGLSSVDQQPELGIRQVISPGAHIVFGIPKVPLTVGAGFNFAPDLRRVSDMEDEFKNAYRVAVFLGIDIPLWRLN